MADALHSGHQLARANHEDVYLENDNRGYFNRCAWIEGLGMATKAVSVFPNNPGRSPSRPSVQGAVLLFDDTTGALQAVIDGELVTKWKTTGDSMVASRLLAPTLPRTLVILGAGIVAGYQIQAYRALFPSIEHIHLWNRTQAHARQLIESLKDDHPMLSVCTNLETSVAQADIVCCATMTTNPILKGSWVTPNTHIDLIGAFRPNMREADDQLIKKSLVYVDSFRSTLKDIGEIAIPLSTGVIKRHHLLGDFYDLCVGDLPTVENGAITFFKNGGGGHLDLMCARHIFDIYKMAKSN